MVTLRSRIWKRPLTASRCGSSNQVLMHHGGEAGNERNCLPIIRTVGADIEGADLSGLLSLDELTIKRQALIDNLVLVIPDQKLDPGELLAEQV